MGKKELLVISVAVLLGATAGLFMAFRNRKNQHDDTPPKGAPQLKIGNPGDQSDFPAAPKNERDLG